MNAFEIVTIPSHDRIEIIMRPCQFGPFTYETGAKHVSMLCEYYAMTEPNTLIAPSFPLTKDRE